MRKLLILTICMCTMVLSACDGIEIIKNDSNAEMNGSLTESETTEDRDSWKTAVLTDENGNPIDTTEDTTTLSETTMQETTTSVPETSETTETAVTEPADTSVFSEKEIEETISEKDTDAEKEYSVKFEATVLSAERKYLIVKPDVKSDEFEISRKIIVYTSSAIDFNVGDYITVSYSGEMGLYEDDMPTMEGSVELLEADDVPDIIKDTRKARVEIIRTYSDGLLIQLLEDSGELTAGERATINVRDGLIFEKGGVLEITYSQDIERPENDYPVITIDDYSVESSPKGIIGEIVSINDKWCVVSYIKGFLEAEEGTTIIIIDEDSKNYKEGDRVKFVFTDELNEEPFIIYDVVESFIAE